MNENLEQQNSSAVIHKILAEHNLTLEQLLSFDDETKLMIIESLSEQD